MTTKQKPTINTAGMQMLEEQILKASHPRPGKEHDELVWDECKRYILSCVHQQFQVTQ